jgi:hypothetical protein
MPSNRIAKTIPDKQIKRFQVVTEDNFSKLTEGDKILLSALDKESFVLVEKKSKKITTDQYLQLMSTDTLTNVYQYLYSLSFGELVKLFDLSDTKTYTVTMLKHMLVRDVEEKINELYRRQNGLNIGVNTARRI